MRVLLADDHALFRAGIASLLRAWGTDVVGEASDGLQALELARTLQPDLVLMDIAMPECNGLQATRLIKTELPEVKIVIVTVSDQDDDLFEAIKSGAEGYLLKDMSEQELERTLQAIAAGEPALSSGLAARILDEFARLSREGAAKRAEEDALTPREREVLQLVAEGATNREAAKALYLSEHTINFHMKNILHKLHSRNRAQAVVYAVQTGLVNPPERR
jgi:DNA-binding NarL/FixJ family response regulator